MTQAAQSTSLYSRHGGSDKEYHVYLRPRGDGWTVDYAHGPRGKALKPGTKTATPLPYDKAHKKYQSLINEKKNGDSHYVEGEAGTEYVAVGQAGALSLFGVFTQQPTTMSRRQLDAIMADDQWGMQEKANGENRLLGIFENEVRGGNKKGQCTAIPGIWVQELRGLSPFVANGEHVGDRFLAFDLLSLNGQDTRGWPQRKRYEALAELQRSIGAVAPSFGLLECVYTTEAKLAMFERIESARLEGVVAKDARAAYDEGRNANTLKFKFCETVTCIVLAKNQQRSVQIGLLDQSGQVTSVGNVTIPGNKPVPDVDSLVDVEYLYFNPGGALEQPVYDPDNKSPRSDIDRDECTIDQITRLKPSEEDVDPQALRRRERG